MMPEVLAANMAMIKSIDHENANGVVQCSEVGRKSKCCGDDVCGSTGAMILMMPGARWGVAAVLLALVAAGMGVAVV